MRQLREFPCFFWQQITIVNKFSREQGLCLKIVCFILVHESISYCFKTFTIHLLGNEFFAFVNASKKG